MHNNNENNNDEMMNCVYKNIYSRAFRCALGVGLVSIARALVLVPVGSRRHAHALRAADSTVLQAPVFEVCLRAPHPTLLIAVAFVFHFISAQYNVKKIR